MPSTDSLWWAIGAAYEILTPCYKKSILGCQQEKVNVESESKKGDVESESEKGIWSEPVQSQEMKAGGQGSKSEQ